MVKDSYPVYYQYGKYSVRFADLSAEDLERLREAVQSLGVELSYNGVNF